MASHFAPLTTWFLYLSHLPPASHSCNICFVTLSFFHCLLLVCFPFFHHLLPAFLFLLVATHLFFFHFYPLLPFITASCLSFMYCLLPICFLLSTIYFLLLPFIHLLLPACFSVFPLLAPCPFLPSLAFYPRFTLSIVCFLPAFLYPSLQFFISIPCLLPCIPFSHSYAFCLLPFIHHLLPTCFPLFPPIASCLLPFLPVWFYLCTLRQVCVSKFGVKLTQDTVGAWGLLRPPDF